MRIKDFLYLTGYGIRTILRIENRPIVGTVILTDKCNLKCKHCSVNNITAVVYKYETILGEMKTLYEMGVRILVFCGGETFMWSDEEKNLRTLVIEAKKMGFLIVNIVTNGTFSIDLPEADLVMLSLDGDRQRHNEIRGETYDRIMENVDKATCSNICFYMAINRINKDTIEDVCQVAREKKNVKAVSFNFHTPYPDTVQLKLTKEEKRQCCNVIERMMKEKTPVFNLKSVFPNIIENNFPTPCKQCVVIENGKVSVCGRCVDIEGLCDECGYFFAAEFALLFKGKINVIIDMLKTYLKYV